MHESVMHEIHDVDIFISVAAVSDYKALNYSKK